MPRLNLRIAALSSMARQAFAPASNVGACIISAIAAALLVGSGTLIAPPIGWPLGGAASLVSMSILSVCFYRGSIHIVGEEAAREILLLERIQRAVRLAFSLNLFDGAWLWKGIIAAILVAEWSNWVTARDVGFQSSAWVFAGAGGLAFAAVVYNQLKATRGHTILGDRKVV